MTEKKATRAKYDHRGLRIYTQFDDTRGCTVTVKQSSAYGLGHCWVFCDNTAGTYTDLPTGASTSPHLTKAQARRLARALMRFAGGVL